MPRDTRKLHVFQLADRLALDMYRATRELPRQEQFEIGKQLRRAALSVPTNLIEGGQHGPPRAGLGFASGCSHGTGQA